jgi:hypothetical protein
MNEKAEKHFKYTAAKTCKIKSENQVKGNVKGKIITKQYLPYLLTIYNIVQNVGRDF